jgi:Sec-independent protein translocase protein TatA
VSARPPGWRVAALGTALAAGGAWHAVLILVILAAVLWADEIAQAAARALSVAMGAVRERARQRRELNLKRLELEAALARQSRPVRCAHEHPEDVRDLTGTLVARLCPQCEAQLPPDFEVMKEDR